MWVWRGLLRCQSMPSLLFLGCTAEQRAERARVCPASEGSALSPSQVSLLCSSSTTVRLNSMQYNLPQHTVEDLELQSLDPDGRYHPRRARSSSLSSSAQESDTVSLPRNRGNDGVRTQLLDRMLLTRFSPSSRPNGSGSAACSSLRRLSSSRTTRSSFVSTAWEGSTTQE